MIFPCLVRTLGNILSGYEDSNVKILRKCLYCLLSVIQSLLPNQIKYLFTEDLILNLFEIITNKKKYYYFKNELNNRKKLKILF